MFSDDKDKANKKGIMELPKVADVEMVKANKLDTDDMMAIHGKLLDYFQRELSRQYENRQQMAIDEDYYDSIQWSEEDAAILQERGQAPIVYNVISQTVNWIIGSEKRGRTDFRVLPREKSDSKPAERKSQILKYINDVNRTTFHRSRAFEDATKVGLGWLEDGIQGDPEQELIFTRYETWRNMLWDSASTEFDLSDARYIFRTKWVDEDIAKAFFPARHGLIERSASSEAGALYGAEYGDEAMDAAEAELTVSRGYESSGITNQRRRIRMIEAWFKTPIYMETVSGGSFDGQEFDEDNEVMVAEIVNGKARINAGVRMRMHVAIMTAEGLLYFGRSPYRHNKFPFTPIWGYRRGRDGMPYGVIRSVRDIQDDINKRASKAQYILATNKVVMDEDAVADIDEFMEQVSRPDGIIRKKRGAELAINVDRELAPAHMDLMARSIQMIQSVSGVTDELLGRTTNAVSGAAITARQEQGSLSTSKLFDNLRLAVQLQGEKLLSLIEQYFSEEKIIRITNNRGQPDYVPINDGLPENDITRNKADFIVSESDWRASIRQAQAEQLLELMTRMPPEVTMVMLDLVIESMDLPNREELVSRIRQVTGQEDPTDEQDMTPEQVQAKQEKMQAMQQQQALQQAAIELEQAEKQANIKKTEAEALRTEVDARKKAAEIITESISQQQTAIDAAKQVIESPGSADVADVMLQESGFVSQSELAELGSQMEQEAMAQQQAAQQQVMQEQMAQGLPQQPQIPQTEGEV